MGGRRAEPDQGGLARDAALMVAVLAAVLAASAFLANESIKEVITGETKAADASARLEAADVKTTIAGANSVLLRVVGAGDSREARAAARTAQALENRIQAELAPVERRLSAYIRRDETERERANQRHLVYELSEVGLQVGIVMAGISILAGRRWLLAAAGLLGTVGVVLVVVGLAS